MCLLSYVNIALLKGINDPSLKWDTLPITFQLVTETRDFLQQFLSYVRAFRVINRDATNSLTYRYDHPNKALITVPPSSEDGQEMWTSFIQVIPNAVTGSGVLEVDLVKMEDAQLGR